MGQALSGSRNLFALAEQGDLPRVLRPRASALPHAGRTRSSSRPRSSLVLAVSGTFVDDGGGQRDQPAGRVRRDLRVGAAAARHGRHRAVAPALFRVPLGPVIPAAAMTIALVIVLAATPAQLVGGAFTFAVGAALFLIARRLRSDP